MKKTITTLALIASASLCSAALYSIDFSVAAQGATHSGSGTFAAGSATGTNWTLDWPGVPTDGTTNEFVTVGGLMRVQDWGANGTVTSDSIAVTSDGTVDITGAALSIGGDSFNSVGSEGITWFYSVNGGAAVTHYLGETELGGTQVDAGTDLGHSFSGIAVSSGDTLEVGFTVNVNGSGDGAEISSLVVELTPIPEPSSIALLGLGGLATLLRRRR
jgi:hypothetical protein